jgi:hypothetical protein
VSGYTAGPPVLLRVLGITPVHCAVPTLHHPALSILLDSKAFSGLLLVARLATLKPVAAILAATVHCTIYIIGAILKSDPSARTVQRSLQISALQIAFSVALKCCTTFL